MGIRVSKMTLGNPKNVRVKDPWVICKTKQPSFTSAEKPGVP